MIEFKDFVYLPEAVPISTYKEYLKQSGIYNKEAEAWFNSPLFTSEKINKIFQEQGTAQKSGRKYRIYIPFQASLDIEDSPIANRVKALLYPLGYNTLRYSEGYINDSRKNTLKVGKILNKLISLPAEGTIHPKTRREAKEVLDSFIKDPSRGLSPKDKLLIVISRHPYDVLGMSTDRHWTSCMNLGSPRIHYHGQSPTNDPEGLTSRGVGIMQDVVPFDLKHGTLVAYLIRDIDTNLERPLARVNIKPYPRLQAAPDRVDEIDPNDPLYNVSTTVYGIKSSNFRDTVKIWVDTYINAGTAVGSFIQHPGLYKDSDPTRIETFSQSEVDQLVKNIHTIPDVQRYIRNNYTQDKSLRDFCQTSIGIKLLGDVHGIYKARSFNDIELRADKNSLYITNLAFAAVHFTKDVNMSLKFEACMFYKCAIMLNPNIIPAFIRCTFNNCSFIIPPQFGWKAIEMYDIIQSNNKCEQNKLMRS